MGGQVALIFPNIMTSYGVPSSLRKHGPFSTPADEPFSQPSYEITVAKKGMLTPVAGRQGERW